MYERRLAEVDDQAPIAVREPDRSLVAQVPAYRRLGRIAGTDGANETDTANGQLAELGSACGTGKSDGGGGGPKDDAVAFAACWVFSGKYSKEEPGCPCLRGRALSENVH